MRFLIPVRFIRNDSLGSTGIGRKCGSPQASRTSFSLLLTLIVIPSEVRNLFAVSIVLNNVVVNFSIVVNKLAMMFYFLGFLIPRHFIYILPVSMFGLR